MTRHLPSRYARPLRHAVTAAAVACMVLVASGCMKMDAAVDLRPDGSGRLSTTVVLGDQLTKMLEADGEELTEDQLLEDFFPDGAPDGATAELKSSGGRTTIVATAPFASPAELEDTLTADDGLFESFELYSSGGGWDLRATVAPSADMGMGTSTGTAPTAPPADPRQEFDKSCVDQGGTPSEAAGELVCTTADATWSVSSDFVDADLGGVFAGAVEPPEVSFTVTFPGKVGKNNATKVDGSTATWKLKMAGKPQKLTATATNGAGFPVLPLAFGVTLAAAVLVGAVALSRRQLVPAPAAVGVPTYTGGPTPESRPRAPFPDAPVPVAEGWDQFASPAAPSEPGTDPTPTAPQPAAPTAPPGWYPDPSGQPGDRYWDGTSWADPDR